MNKNYILLGLISLLWGSQFFWNDWALQGADPLTIAFFRAFLGAVTLALAVPFFREKKNELPKRSLWKDYMLIAFCEATLPFILIPLGQRYVDSSIAAVLVGTVPIFTIIIAGIFIPSERFHKGSVLCVILGFAAVYILINPSGEGLHNSSLLYQFIILTGAVSFAFALVLLRRLPAINPLVSVRNVLSCAAGQLLIVHLVLRGVPQVEMPEKSLWAIVILGVFCAGLVYVFYMSLIRRAGVTFTSLANYLIPFVGMVLGLGFLGDPFSWNLVWAMSLIIIAFVAYEKLSPKT